MTDSKDIRYHPTQKPSELVARLIEMFSEQGELILDPFMGSGTTAVAAIRTNRHYIGYELDKYYFDIACNRIDDVKKEIVTNTNVNIMEDNYERKNINSRNANYINQAI